MRPNLAFGPIDSLTQYLLYLSVVALGIFVPLGVQRWLRIRSERALVARTLVALAAEVKANEKRLASSIETFEATLAALAEELAFFKAAWHAIAAGEDAGIASNQSRHNNVSYALTVRTAWDSALLGQALGLLPPEQLARFSRVYHLQNVFDQSRTVLLDTAMKSNWLDAPCDLRVREHVDRRIEALLVLEATLRYVTALAHSVLQAYGSALNGDPPSPGPEGRL